MEFLSHAGLRAALDKVEQELGQSGGADAARVAALSASTIHWARVSRQTKHLRRLATLLAETGDTPAAVNLLRAGVEVRPGDAQMVMLLSDALVFENDLAGALAAFSGALAEQPPNARCVKKAVRLYLRLDRFDDALKLARELEEQGGAYAGVLITALVAADQQEEALSKARQVLATEPQDLPVIHACYKALAKLDGNEAEIADARARLLACAEALGSGHLWRAQLLDRDGKAEAAEAEIAAGLAASPNNPALLKRRAENALDRGNWGHDAGILLDARPHASTFSQLARGIASADSLLKFHGGSLEAAAQTPAKFAHINTPEFVFEQVVRTAPPPDASQKRFGVVMIAGSLGGYGAERILANTFRLLAARRQFGWTKFYIADFGRRTSEEFRQSLSGIPDSEVVRLDGPCRPEPPLAWLWGPQAICAAQIFERLKRDRPAIVHASLEPLNVFAALAAVLAGVPRIVLHTHNMRPTDLHIRDAAHLKGCYQALLSRHEVVLAACAQACINDFIDWLELKDLGKLRVVHNGYEFDEIRAADENKRAALRAEYGIAPDAIVVGAAIRLTESKQPLLWVDAAAEILRSRPGCRFVMFGDGDLRMQIEERIHSNGLTGHFILPGRVTDLYDRLPLLDLYLLSSRTEGLPNALIEAQAAGVPVVAFDVGGVAETMLPGETGRLVKESSAQALAAAVLGAVSDQNWRSQAAATAPRFVRDAFSLEKMIVTLSGIFSEGY